MSFAFEFTAKQSDAVAIVEEEFAPESVKQFLRQGLSAFGPESLVHIKAQGHLFNNDYKASTGTLVCEQVLLRLPKSG